MTLFFSLRNRRSTAYILSTVPKLFNRHPQNLPLRTLTTLRPHRYSHALSTRSRRLTTASVTTRVEQVRVYTKADHTPIEKLASSLASAFQNDPVFYYIFDPKHHDVVSELKTLLTSLLKSELSRPDGQTTIHVSDDDSTVAVWHHVDHWKFPLFMSILIPFKLISTVGWRAFRFMDIFSRVEEFHPTDPHMHLFIIGTDAEMQGKGKGGKVISKMLQHCDSQGIAAYLESSSERNLPFYMKHGFKVTQKIPPIRQDCPPMFAMWRDPKPVRDNLQD